MFIALNPGQVSFLKASVVMISPGGSEAEVHFRLMRKLDQIIEGGDLRLSRHEGVYLLTAVKALDKLDELERIMQTRLIHALSQYLGESPVVFMADPLKLVTLRLVPPEDFDLMPDDEMSNVVNQILLEAGDLLAPGLGYSLLKRNKRGEEEVVVGMNPLSQDMLLVAVRNGLQPHGYNVIATPYEQAA